MNLTKDYYDELEGVCKKNINQVATVDFKSGTVKNIKNNPK